MTTTPLPLDEPDHVLSDPFGAYLRRIGTVELLTAQEEVELAFAIEAGVLAAARLAAGVADDELRADLQILAGEGERARLRMIQANLRLVVSMARRLGPSGTSLFDPVQDGTLGLIHAVRKFDFRRGCKFSTYATWWIRQAITRGMAEEQRVRLPTKVATRLRACQARRHELAAAWGRDPTPAELAEACGGTPAEMADLLRLAADPVSLEAAIEADPGGEQLPDRHTAGPEEMAAALLVRESIREALGELPELEREVLVRRFGLYGSPRGRRAVAAELGLDYRLVRRAEQAALTSLRATPSLAALADGVAPPLAG
jgi:RNA polymerase primary sigma factor